MQNTRLKIVAVAIFLTTNLLMADEKTLTSPREYPQLGGKGSGMGHDYQKNTPGPGKGKPNYQGGQTGLTDDTKSPQTNDSKPENQANKPTINAHHENNQTEGAQTQNIDSEQKNRNPDSQTTAPIKRQRGSSVGFPGYRGQGGTGYKQHRQFGSPPLYPSTSEKQASQINKNTNTGKAVEASPENLASENNSKNKSTENRRALLHAAAFGDLITVNKMLKLGVSANVKAKDKKARSVLILAAAGGHLDIISELLKNGAKVDERDSTGQTALNWAAMRSRNDVALLLLKNGANINTQSNVEVSPLLYAVGTNNSELVKLLLEHGADIEVISRKNKMTPLLLAIENKNKDILKILIDKGAKVSKSNKESIKKIMSTNENS